MNPMNLLQAFLGKGGSPQSFIQNIGMSNPILNNLIGMAKSGNSQGIETFARNMFKEKGRDFDKEFTEFRKNFK
nr:MAG TPA: hypothetical protein [Caudoviricetes sp.]